MIINRKKIWSLSWPLIIANFTIPLVGLTDTVIMGHMPSSLYLAAIAIGGIVFNFMYAGLNFLRMSTTGIVAQKLGANNFEEVFFSLLRPLLIAFIIGISLFFFKSYLYDLSLYVLNPNHEIQKFYKEYLFVRMLGLPAGLLNIVFLGWFFGMQKTKSVILQLMVINLVNVFSSLYLAVYLDYGIYGVALGSVLAQVSGLFLSIIIFINYFKILNFDLFKLSKLLNIKGFFNLFSISKNLFLRTMLLVSVQAYLIKKAGLIGVDELAAMEVLLVIFALSSYTLDAFAHAAESTVGVSIGAKNKRNIYKSIKNTTELALIFSLIVGVILYVSDYYIIAIFTDINVLRDLTIQVWALVVITPFVSMLAFQLDGIFIGATLAKEMRNCIIFSSIIFYLTIEYFIENSLNLKSLYSCFLLFLILRGVFLTIYLPRVFKLVKN
ncbi:MATE family efflux transporter [Pseudomonadota bacterium]|nr:MATE family efflux transporter [Alphaproteobacteria bacterium]MDC0457419.1 MATE family efflux transporter [Alphaproteobacteria bacterium]MDC1357115.1 MATE family efflux transporter [Pseudomonadota bacterium]